MNIIITVENKNIIMCTHITTIATNKVFQDVRIRDPSLCKQKENVTALTLFHYIHTHMHLNMPVHCHTALAEFPIISHLYSFYYQCKLFRRLCNFSYYSCIGTVCWSKTMIEKRGVPGSSPAWKRKDFFQPCCDPQLIGSSWPGISKTWMWQMGFRPLAYGWWI